MTGLGEPGVAEKGLFFFDEGEDGRAVGVIGRAIWGDGEVPGGEERACHDEVAGAVGVDAVFGESETRVGFAGLLDGGEHGAMDVEHGPSIRFGF